MSNNSSLRERFGKDYDEFFKIKYEDIFTSKFIEKKRHIVSFNPREIEDYRHYHKDDFRVKIYVKKIFYNCNDGNGKYYVKEFKNCHAYLIFRMSLMSKIMDKFDEDKTFNFEIIKESQRDYILKEVFHK